MKRIAPLLLALACIFSSCKKDENNDDGSDPAAINWKLFQGVMSYHSAGALALTPDNSIIMAGIYNTNYQVYKTNSGFDLTWEKNIGQQAFEEANAIAVTDNNECLIVGSSGLGLQAQIYAVMLDASGNKLWSDSYGWSAVDAAYGISASLDQTSFVICGNSQYTSFGDIFAMKINSSGDTLWFRVYEDIGEETAYAITATSDGGFVMTGRDENNNNKDLALVKIDGNGNMDWFRFFGGNAWEEGFYVIEDQEGNLVACGMSQSNYSDVYVVKTTSAGTLIWEYTYGLSNKYEKGFCIQDADNGYVISGSQYVIENIDDNILLLKINRDGDFQWQTVYGGSGSDYGNAVRVDENGAFILAGTTKSSSDDGNIFLLKTDANGNIQ